jgi:hypothetical protein
MRQLMGLGEPLRLMPSAFARVGLSAPVRAFLRKIAHVRFYPSRLRPSGASALLGNSPPPLS